MDAASEAEVIRQEAARLGVDLSVEQAEKLSALTDLLLSWSRRANLTAITDPEGVRVKHHLDSLTLCRWLPAGSSARLADVGSGAGFPGLPVAIARPMVEAVLVESVLRKVRFLEEAAVKLGLANVRVIRERAEVLGHDPAWRERFDFVAIRAVGSLALSVELCAPLAAVGGTVLVMKGPRLEEEWEAGRRLAERVGLGPLGTERVVLPGPIQRVIVVGHKVGPTPARYPRRPGLVGRVG
ncbi:MAG: 16S rRNA (guanine(527)-N(7))-methyltransferase RsmG [Bacillota bacterium]